LHDKYEFQEERKERKKVSLRQTVPPPITHATPKERRYYDAFKDMMEMRV